MFLWLPFGCRLVGFRQKNPASGKPAGKVFHHVLLRSPFSVLSFPLQYNEQIFHVPDIPGVNQFADSSAHPVDNFLPFHGLYDVGKLAKDRR